MEDLNKNQIVLLTLLISFVTSIATGIMTTSLLQQAPVEVTRNINRIVEKTIETVTVPGVTTPGQKEVTTVIVKEEDSITDSINKNIKSVVRIEQKDGAGVSTFYGIGLVVNKDGLISAVRKTIDSSNTYTAVMSDGIELPLTSQGSEKNTNFVLFKAVLASKTADKPAVTYNFTPATFSSLEPKLGQTVMSLGGDTTNAVAVGRVISLETKDSTVGTTTTKYLSGIITDLSLKDTVSGSPTFNLSGDIIGIKVTGDSSKSFLPISVLKNEIVSLNTPAKTQ